MVNYREILRMTANGSYGIRQIKADAHCSYEKIRETQDAAKAKGIKWPLDDDVTNEELQEKSPPLVWTAGLAVNDGSSAPGRTGSEHDFQPV